MKSRENKPKRTGALPWLALAFSVLLYQAGCSTPAEDIARPWNRQEPWISEMRTVDPSISAQNPLGATSRPASAAMPVQRPGAAENQSQKARNTPETVNISFENTPLTEVVEFFRRVTDLNFVIDAQAVDELGGEQNLRVTMKLRDVKLKNALYHCLEPLGLTWCIRHEAVFITTPQRAEEASEKKVYIYSVTDLTLVPGTSSSGASSGGSASQGPSSSGSPSNRGTPRSSGRR